MPLYYIVDWFTRCSGYRGGYQLFISNRLSCHVRLSICSFHSPLLPTAHNASAQSRRLKTSPQGTSLDITMVAKSTLNYRTVTNVIDSWEMVRRIPDFETKCGLLLFQRQALGCFWIQSCHHTILGSVNVVFHSTIIFLFLALPLKTFRTRASIQSDFRIS